MKSKFLNQAQIKDLQGRIREAYNTAHHRGRYDDDDVKEPDHVMAARKVIKDYENETDKKRDVYNARLSAAHREVSSKILFMEPADALAAVVEFEKMDFNGEDSQ